MTEKTTTPGPFPEKWSTEASGRGLGGVLADFGFTLSAQAILGHVLYDHPEKATELLAKMDAGQRARIAAAAYQLGVLAESP